MMVHNSFWSHPYDYTGIYYVKPTASGAMNCQSWDDACELRDALSTASSGDEIWVAAGTHKPSATGNRHASFILKNGVGVYGGFAGTETLRTQRNFATNVTILSGDLNGDDVGFTNNGENSYHVVIGSGTDATAILDGFTISGGNANGAYPDSSGGGMANRTNGSPTLTNLIFSVNSAEHGGGLYNEVNSNPALTHVTFSGNFALYNGGGLYNYQSDPILTDTTFSGNSTPSYGGGLANSGSSNPTLTNITFNGNSAHYGGGLANRSTSNPTLTNVTFGGNTATTGGGMYNESTSNPTLTNVTFKGNTAAGVNGGGMYNSNSSPTLKNVIIADSASSGDCVNFGSGSLNAASANNLIEASVNACGLTDGTNGNIVGQDPRLDALADNGGSTSTFALLPGSPAIDAGDDATCAAAPVNNLDQRAIARPQVGACDIGAFESQGFSLGSLAGTPQSTTLNTVFATPLGLTVSSSFGEPVGPGGQVTLTAPGSGASVTFAPSAIASTDAGGVISQPVTANGIIGSYTVTAASRGAGGSASFNLTNLKFTSTVGVVSSLNPSLPGQSVTFTATVAVVAPGVDTWAVKVWSGGCKGPPCLSTPAKA